MAATINFFQFIQKSYQIAGIRPIKNQNVLFAAYNWRNSTILLALWAMFVASLAFFLYKANSFKEYSASFYMAVALLVNIVCLPSIISKMTDISVLMEKFGEFVEQSK